MHLLMIVASLSKLYCLLIKISKGFSIIVTLKQEQFPEMPDFFVIRWEVDHVSELSDDGRESPIEHHFGLPWSVKLHKLTIKTSP